MKKPRVVVTEPRTSRWGLLGGDVCSAAGMRSWWMSCWLWRRWHCNVVWVFGIVICYNCDTRDRSVRTSLKQSLIFSWLVVKLEAWLILCDVSLWAHLLTPYHMFGRWCQIEGANNHRFAILPQSVSFCFRQPLSLRSNPSTKRGFMLVTFKSPPPPRPNFSAWLSESCQNLRITTTAKKLELEFWGENPGIFVSRMMKSKNNAFGLLVKGTRWRCHINHLVPQHYVRCAW